MITKITGRHMEVTDAMRAYIDKKLARLAKYKNRFLEVEVVIGKEGASHKVEMILKVDNSSPFVVHHSGEDAYAVLDVAIDKIERQLIKHKEKIRNYKSRTGAAESTADAIESYQARQEGKE